jgi:hypothetical protein
VGHTSSCGLTKEIVELGKVAQDKKVPLMAEYSRLPAHFQKHAPHPNDLGRG